MFDKMKDLYNMQKQAKQVKKELKNIHVEAEEDGVKIVVTAEQEVISIDIAPEKLGVENKAKLEKTIINVMQKATKKAQEIAAAKMRDIMGSMGLGGM
ncbi:MAG: YbaB/EbfC family nucleoid-associated protein [Candidatus Gracilibacteria bacterium]|nr:YbaB/EbfC family nucleoid-associated protein [Candidatus Gracilibacteria bacterium]